MQKPINEQYFDLWVELDEIWKKTSIEELTDWSQPYNIRLKQLQTQLEALDKKSTEKWLPLFQPVYDQFYGKHLEEKTVNALKNNPIGKMVVNVQYGKCQKLSRLFQGMQLDVLKTAGKCNCQLKHDLKMNLNLKGDLELDFIKLWEPNTQAELHQCPECQNYWEWQPDIGYGGAKWKFIGPDPKWK
jgi:hypothetical protein